MKKIPKQRLDSILVDRGLFLDLKAAAAAIVLGRVRGANSGAELDKPGMKVASDIEVILEESEAFVGRGARKLDSFLTSAKVNVQGRVVLDVGSSTGGFTDCLLQRGAKKVYAVDVGRHQMHEKLRRDSRVSLFEETDIRKFDFSLCASPPDLVVVDVSFISLRQIVPTLLSALPAALYIFLFKPQFEVAAQIPKKRGVAPALESEKSLKEMLLFLEGLGLNSLEIRNSEIKGAKGNQDG